MVLEKRAKVVMDNVAEIQSKCRTTGKSFENISNAGARLN